MIKHNNNTQEYFFEEGCYISELWNEIADPEVSIAKARVAIGETTKPHALKRTVERYLILSGEGVVHVGDKQPLSVKKNDVVYIPANTSQFIENTGDCDLVFLAICSPRFKPENYTAL